MIRFYQYERISRLKQSVVLNLGFPEKLGGVPLYNSLVVSNNRRAVS